MRQSPISHINLLKNWCIVVISLSLIRIQQLNLCIMINNQPEKLIATVFTFGDKGIITSSSTTNITGYLTAPGGTFLAATELAIVIPRKGKLKNLYWTSESSTLTANGNSITVYVKDSPTLPRSPCCSPTDGCLACPSQVGLVWVAPEHGRRSQTRTMRCDRCTWAK